MKKILHIINSFDLGGNERWDDQFSEWQWAGLDIEYYGSSSRHSLVF